MKIKVPYSYMEGFLPTPRCHKLRFREVRAIYEAEIKEVDKNDLKLAIRYEDFVTALAPPSRVWINLYWYGERLWKVSRYRDHHANKKWEELTPVDEEWLGYLMAPYREYLGVNIDKQECDSAIEKNARDWLLCDGILYEPAKEPLYYICTFGLGHNHGGIGTSLSVSNRGYNPNLPSEWYFNAFQREEAIAKAKEIALRRGDTDSIRYIENAERIEVLMPECIKLDPQNWDEPGDKLAF